MDWLTRACFPSGHPRSLADAVAESIAQRGGDPVQRQSRLEEVARCRRIVETSLFGTAWDPAASIKRANDPDAAVHSRTHAMRDIINLSEEHEEQLRWLLKLEGYLAEVGLPAVNRDCPVCFDNFVTDTAPGRSGIDLMKVSMCNHVAHRGCLAQMMQVAEDKANRNGGVLDGIPCPSCNNRMTSGLSLSKVTAGGRVASTKTARVNRGIVAGDRVRIHGLVSRPELNGRAGTATVLTEGSGRWAVQLKDRAAAISVKIANLVIAGEGVPIDLKQHREMAAVADRSVTQANAAR